MNQEQTADADRESTERFVRQVLGCHCPAEVFRWIEKTSSIHLDNGIALRSRINIGNRLLIYVVAADSVAFVEESLPELVKTGREERDTKGFNRFRLVLASDHRGEIEEVAEKTFKALAYGDEKIYLHVLEKSELSLLEGRETASSQLRTG